ncbi:hypothetical protein LR48_Vigan09g137500 [Vigna angularis]|uniref:Uncharacterized protein n=1 Tax=Phaseolus angularis TaxID=3914 RepID=A0A0L9VCC3_PHAAN|nr:hypothetical protein LR48_Vigan09g137500 [Vigna angularis]
MTLEELETLNILDNLPRQLSSRKVINCLAWDDLSFEVFGIMEAKNPNINWFKATAAKFGPGESSKASPSIVETQATPSRVNTPQPDSEVTPKTSPPRTLTIHQSSPEPITKVLVALKDITDEEFEAEMLVEEIVAEWVIEEEVVEEAEGNEEETPKEVGSREETVNPPTKGDTDSTINVID